MGSHGGRDDNHAVDRLHSSHTRFAPHSHREGHAERARAEASERSVVVDVIVVEGVAVAWLVAVEKYRKEGVVEQTRAVGHQSYT